MILDERMRVFINSLDRGNPAWLNDLEAEARKERVPIIRTETQSLIKFLLAAGQPASILEVGTAVGFSALMMSEYMPEGCHITTIENYERRIEEARINFARAGRSDVITLLEGDAAGLLPALAGPYDFIFMDAAKGQYLSFMPQALRLLAPGGFLVSDNALQDGDVTQSRYALTRRARTTHARMREYLYELKHHPSLETAVLPVGDGVAVSVKKKDVQETAAHE